METLWKIPHYIYTWIIGACSLKSEQHNRNRRRLRGQD